ncbi:Na+ dependent nucleoside transporter N-terminal domain-containing protein, partial [Corynebacterium amycolatum]|uniref:Na+ dependent nucleoside transporter N-terminal domain-containing protein n=1 Tax=Corynebacterium amycolatum TaxID=43765 RepID=UPI003999B60C
PQPLLSRKKTLVMDRLQGLLGIILVIGFAIAISKNRRAFNWRTLGVGLLLQAVTSPVRAFITSRSCVTRP